MAGLAFLCLGIVVTVWLPHNAQPVESPMTSSTAKTPTVFLRSNSSNIQFRLTFEKLKRQGENEHLATGFVIRTLLPTFKISRRSVKKEDAHFLDHLTAGKSRVPLKKTQLTKNGLKRYMAKHSMKPSTHKHWRHVKLPDSISNQKLQHSVKFFNTLNHPHNRQKRTANHTNNGKEIRSQHIQGETDIHRESALRREEAQDEKFNMVKIRRLQLKRARKQDRSRDVTDAGNDVAREPSNDSHPAHHTMDQPKKKGVDNKKPKQCVLKSKKPCDTVKDKFSEGAKEKDKKYDSESSRDETGKREGKIKDDILDGGIKHSLKSENHKHKTHVKHHTSGHSNMTNKEISYEEDEHVDKENSQKINTKSKTKNTIKHSKLVLADSDSSEHKQHEKHKSTPAETQEEVEKLKNDQNISTSGEGVEGDHKSAAQRDENATKRKPSKKRGNKTTPKAQTEPTAKGSKKSAKFKITDEFDFVGKVLGYGLGGRKRMTQIWSRSRKRPAGGYATAGLARAQSNLYGASASAGF